MATSYNSDRPPSWAAVRASVIANQFPDTRPYANDWYPWRQCPFCGYRKKGAAAFHETYGFKCFKCQKRPTLEELIALAGGVVDESSLMRLPPAAPKPMQAWQFDPMAYHRRYIAPLDLAARWAAYKPISEESIMRYQLGYGTLPPHSFDGDRPIYTMGCDHKRLIYANLENRDRQPTAFRGRQVTCECKDSGGDRLKWITVKGALAWLWGESLLAQAEGRSVIVVENPIDAILTMQAMPDVIAVAGTGGASTWRPDWTRAIALAAPASVLVALDNDLIGYPNRETAIAQLDSWIAKQTAKHGQRPSEAAIAQQAGKAMGPKIANGLRAEGAKADLWHWPDGTAAKMDFGQYLIDQGCF